MSVAQMWSLSLSLAITHKYLKILDTKKIREVFPAITIFFKAINSVFTQCWRSVSSGHRTWNIGLTGCPGAPDQIVTSDYQLGCRSNRTISHFHGIGFAFFTLLPSDLAVAGVILALDHQASLPIGPDASISPCKFSTVTS